MKVNFKISFIFSFWEVVFSDTNEKRRSYSFKDMSIVSDS